MDDFALRLLPDTSHDVLRLTMPPEGEQRSGSFGPHRRDPGHHRLSVSDELKAPGPGQISLHRSGKQSPQELQQSRRPINDDIGLVEEWWWGLHRIHCNP